MMSTPPNKPVKPGYQTTEFWVTLAIVIGSLTATLAGNLPDKYAAIATAVSAAAYAIARGIAKH